MNKRFAGAEMKFSTWGKRRPEVIMKRLKVRGKSSVTSQADVFQYRRF